MRPAAAVPGSSIAWQLAAIRPIIAVLFLSPRRPSVLERFIERLLYASRWLLAPLYLGLSLVLIAIAIKFFEEVYHLLGHILEMGESDMVLVSLALIDLTLVGSLVVMVMFSGYENFVSRIDVREGDDQLDWLGKLDAGTLKLKVAASIVAISSIHLLQIFVNVPQTPSDKLMWYVVIHLTFVVSALLMGVLDRLAFSSHRDHGEKSEQH
jgi:uncharacterized protein (TIGR00645 family)